MKKLVFQLKNWQRLEWISLATWGFARIGLLVCSLLILACITDWVIDRYRDTPILLRILMTIGQLTAAIVAVYAWMYRLRGPSIDQLAARAEQAFPTFGHRLVTALQLNRPTAKTAGMSPTLIAEVTKEAEEMSSQQSLASLADSKGLKRGLMILVPLALLMAGFAAWKPDLTAALLARQALLNVDIPRSVQITNLTTELWPAGDAVELKLEVTGHVPSGATGVAVVKPEGQPTERFELIHEDDGPNGGKLYVAKLPPSSAPFEFTARIGGGRLREAGQVRFVARPTVPAKNLIAWVILPAFVDPKGERRYERLMPQGDVYAYPGSDVRVEATASKPIVKASVILLSRSSTGVDTPVKTIPMTISEDGLQISARFPAPERPSAYRIEVEDEYGFKNLNPPRRILSLLPDEPPRVTLLPEILKDPADQSPIQDYEMVNGMPLWLGGQAQVGYVARSPLGIRKAQIVYRVNDGPWTTLPLSRTQADTAKVGQFRPEFGLFQRSGVMGQVEFYQIPSPDPETIPDGLEAGGRYNFQVAALTKIGPDGEPTKLVPGDRVEYLVEVFDRNPAPGREPGRSESRIKSVVTQDQLKAWLEQRDQSRERLRVIEERQRGVFGRDRS